MAGMPSTAAAQSTSPTATSEIYDFSGFSDETLLNLFLEAHKQGRKYPTEAEFAAAGIQQSDIAFVRSHVRNKGIMDRSDRLVKDTYEKRNLWMNLPMDSGKGNDVGHPGKIFSSDVFSLWNYTNLFGAWNHSVFSAPAAWTDAAHKNGTDMFSGIKFFESWTAGSGDGKWTSFITSKEADGSFTYLEPMINCLMYFGFDGINYNWEDNSWSKADVIAFHKALYKKAAEYGFSNFHIGLYTASSGFATQGDFGANGLFGNSEGRTAETMLNYSGGDFSYQLNQTAKTAIDAMGTTDGLYAGVWIVTMDRGWTRLNADEYSKQVGLCLWGEHSASRFWSYNTGADAYIAQTNYQELLERAASGGNRNPLNRPAISNTGNNFEEKDGKKPLQTFAGLATWIPERTSITGNLPFATHFNLGNGDRYAYKGKKTAGSWYNMANQDIVPTYRWLVVQPGTETASSDIQPSFTPYDQYTGGTCLQLAGNATSSGTDIVLYKTDLNVSVGGAYANVAVKTGKQGDNPSNLYVIVKKKGGEWVEAPVGNVSGNTWQEKKIELSGISQSDVIERIGLRVKGSDPAYKLYVGKLEVNDGVKATPAGVEDVTVEVKEETKSSMSAKIFWNVNATAQKRADWDLLYNDEANIDHFEILYKNGEEGRVSEIGRTTTWATYIADIQFEGADDKPYIGVRAVSTDLKTYSPVEWVAVPRADQGSLPNAKDDSYGISQMDPNCEGAAVARQQRYVTDFTTEGADQNLNYHADGPVADGTQYVNATDQVLKVKQGQTVTLKMKCFNTMNLSPSDGLRYCFAGGWIDLDGSHSFNPDAIEDNPAEGERLFFLGTLRAATPEFETEGITHTFTVPTDARTGKSRLRIVFSDAWFQGSFLPTGLHNKGFSMDFGVEITGDNEQRPAPADAHDQGIADEPEGLNGGGTGINAAQGEVSKVEVAGGNVNFYNADRAWIYGVDGSLVKYIDAPSTLSAASLAKGIYLVKMQSKNIVRTEKIVIK